MRLLSAVFACLLLCGLVAAQDIESAPAPYEHALERIQLAAMRGDTELWLNGLALTELPPELWDLTQLRILYLGTGSQSMGINNRLTNLPPEIANLKNLEFLDLRGNQLSSLPPEISQLSKLRILLLDRNQFDQFPMEIIQLSNLCVLDFGRNQIRQVPHELSQLTGLLGNSFDCLRSSGITYRGIYQINGLSDGGFLLDGNPLISPPQEVIAQGTPAIMDYLRNEAWWHLQKLIMSGAAAIGGVSLLVLGLRWRNQRGKQKRKIHH